MSITDFQNRSGSPRLVRVAAFVLIGLGLIAALFAFREARTRDSSTAGVVDFGPDSVDILITAPTEPEAFADTTIWNLPSQRAAVFASPSGAPALRLAEPGTAALVGLERGETLVALAMLPPGLNEQPVELLVSPVSTALALVGLHPDISVPDQETNLARLLRVGSHPRFAELAASVDGEQALAQWGDAQRALIAEIVNDVATTSVGPAACADEQVVDGPIRSCGITLLNGSKDAVLVADTAGEPCALVPGASERVTGAGRTALLAMLADGVAPAAIDAGAPSNLVEPAVPGAIEAGECGLAPQVFVETDPELWARQVVGYRIWSDEVVPVARLLGSTVESTVQVDSATTALVLSREIAGDGVPAPSERLRVAVGYLQAPATAPPLNLLPPPESAIQRLRNLTDLLAGLYR